MAGSGIAVGVLGPLRVLVDGGPVAVTAGRQRTLLAVLAMAAGRVVPVDRLVIAVWGEELPGDARRSVQTYVARLRRVLGAGAIGTCPGGYLLRVDPDQVDALRFVRLLETAATTADPGTQRARLAEALALWRGTPFEDLRSSWLDRTEAPRLTEQYLVAIERRIDLDLCQGGSDELVAELRELTARHPWREPLWVRLLTVLRRGGRPAEALAGYETIRERLADELGTEPGRQLQQVYADLLAGDPPEPGPLPAAARPRQLPAEVAAFTGRAAELADLDGATTAVIAIDGMAGVGKTALALRAAHRAADRYPDGQLFVDLRGYTQGAGPVTPGRALARLLRALGVPGEQVPAHLDDRAALYRSWLADRRMLVLLDNAASEAQVAPLLPGAPGCLVLVTSRRRLAGLDHARTISLDPLPLADATKLLASTGGDRVATTSPELVAEAVALCGRLPLAIRIAAARLASHPTWSVAYLVGRLRDHRRRLGELVAGGRSVAAALELSYQRLSPAGQRCYRLLGLHPGPDIDVDAIAALVGTTADDARWLLDQLLDANLLTEPAPDRYRFHDLARAHANHTARTAETGPDRRAALTRLRDHYRRSARAAVAFTYEDDCQSGNGSSPRTSAPLWVPITPTLAPSRTGRTSPVRRWSGPRCRRDEPGP